MFVVFEGIDGSGKTTLSNRVAQTLRQDGLKIEHVREGGKFASFVTQSIREFGRDARNMALTPIAELLLYVAREVQLFEEAIAPALGKADAVIADRFLYTAEVLARDGRGLSQSEVEPVVHAASSVVFPDLVILVDVDPHVARARRRVSKIITPDPRPSSRKGLAGVGMQHRLRDGYLRLAQGDPGRWIVVENTQADLDRLAAMLIEVIRTAAIQGATAAITRYRELKESVRPTVPPPANSVRSVADALDAFLAWVDRRSITEPALGAYFLSGLWGPGVDERRRRLAGPAPEVIAYGLRSLGDPVSWELRHALKQRAPGYVARSLSQLVGDSKEAWALRTELATVVPADVATTLDTRDDDASWRLREQLYELAPDEVVGSLKGIGTPRSWALRDRWLSQHGGELAFSDVMKARFLCDSISGLDDERSWVVRKACREAAPTKAITSLTGVLSERAWKWRERYLERAPKAVLRTIADLDDPRAWDMREKVARRCKEALDSMIGLDSPRAWRLREDCADVWPSTVVKSLGPLGLTSKGNDLAVRQLLRHPGQLSLLKHAATLALVERRMLKVG